MVLTSYACQRILEHFFAGYKAPTIKRLMEREEIKVSRVAIWKLLKRYLSAGTIARWEGSGRPSLLTAEVRLIVEQQMVNDDETTAYQLHKILTNKGISISLSTILRCRKALGWTFRGSAYCQLIRQANKDKRLAWAKQYLNECEDGFDDVIWTDESSIQCETHKRFCFRKKGCAPKSKPRWVLN